MIPTLLTILYAVLLLLAIAVALGALVIVVICVQAGIHKAIAERDRARR